MPVTLASLKVSSEDLIRISWRFAFGSDCANAMPAPAALAANVTSAAINSRFILVLPIQPFYAEPSILAGGRHPAGTLRARLSGGRYQGSRLDAHRNGPRMV